MELEVKDIPGFNLGKTYHLKKFTRKVIPKGVLVFLFKFLFVSSRLSVFQLFNSIAA